MVKEESSNVDKRASPHRLLCQCSRSVHPRRSTNHLNDELDNRCEHHEEEQDSLQVTQDSRDPWRCFRDLL
jgi:hypothetical protein